VGTDGLWFGDPSVATLTPELGLSEFAFKVKTFNTGSLGSCTDEERSSERNVL
jgi:hypothetical protein